MREKVFQYVKRKYSVEPDYPLPTAPTFPVMRHEDNRKWFAIIMDVPRDRLGLDGNACRFSHTAARIFSRLSRQPRELDIYPVRRNGFDGRDRSVDRRELSCNSVKKENSL